MAEFWFVSAPLHGHLDWGGFLKTALALQARGEKVVWVSEASIAETVIASGLPFAAIPQSGWLWPLPPTPDLTGMHPQEAMALRYRRALDTWLSEDLIVPAVEALLAIAQERGKPALIASDPFLTAAALAAEALDVPFVVCGWPAMPAPDESALFPIQLELGRQGQGRITRLADRFGLRGTNFAGAPTPAVQSPLLHVSYFSRYWHQADPEFLPQTQFVGGTPTPPLTPPPAWLRDLPADAPLGMVTLGSVFTGDLGFFSWAAQAVVQLGIIPVVVLGRNPIAPENKAQLKASLPRGTYLLNWVDYDHLFPRLKVIVHHGGMGTTHAAVVSGVPQVVVPHAADQRGQARRVAQAKVGLNLTAHDVQSGQLGSAVRAVTCDPKVPETAQKLAEKFAELGGPVRAAELLLGLATW